MICKKYEYCVLYHRKLPFFGLTPSTDRTLVWFWLHRYLTIARPSAKQFLTELDKQFRLQSVTLGMVPFQKKVLKSLELDRFFEEVYGPQNFETLKPPKRWVLIDDQPPGGTLASVKLSWMGLNKYEMTEADWNQKIDTHYIQCSPFKGEEETSLIELIGTVSEKLLTQS